MLQQCRYGKGARVYAGDVILAREFSSRIQIGTTQVGSGTWQRLRFLAVSASGTAGVGSGRVYDWTVRRRSGRGRRFMNITHKTTDSWRHVCRGDRVTCLSSDQFCTKIKGST